MRSIGLPDNPVNPTRALAALLAIGLCGSAAAGPPYVTDDPVPTGEGRWEIYDFVSGSHASGSTDGALGVDLNYGGARDLQLTASLPVEFSRAAGTTWNTGTLEFAAKFRILREEGRRWGPDVALFPRLFVPTSGPDPRHASLLLPLWVGRTLGSWYLFGGGGWMLNPGEGRRNAWQSGLALTHSLGERGSAGIEIYHHSADTTEGQDFTGLNLGLTWKIAGPWSLLASAGPGLRHARSEGQYTFYLSLQYAN